MNKQAIEKIRNTAKRTLKIVKLIEEGKTGREIIEKTKADRQLVDYYINLIKK